MSEPTSSDVHVPAPLGSTAAKPRPTLKDRVARFKSWLQSTDIAPSVDNLETEILKAALIAGDQAAVKAKGVKKSGLRPGETEIGARHRLLKRDREPAPGRRIATVAVMHGDHMLMGKRRDNGKWTTPGGHADPGEDFHAAASRETEEESGIKFDAKNFESLSEPIEKESHGEGDTIHVQPFKLKLTEKPSTSMKTDPDGEVHRWHWVDVSEGLPAHIAKNLHVPMGSNVLLKALGLDDTEEETGDGEEGGDADPGEPDGALAGLYALGEGVGGADWERLSEPGIDDEEAYARALTNLQDDPDFYRKKWQDASNEEPDNPFDDSGLNIDLGSGQARKPGFIGVDLYPYDYGTVVHDLTMGLPFPDQCATTVRMVNALHDLDGVSGDPKPLLSEIQRVLMPGGQFVYEGPNELRDMPAHFQETTEAAPVAKATDGPPWFKQAFTRVVEADPATADDAEPRIALPADQLLAIDALDYSWSDATTSGVGNRVAGYPSQGALVAKSRVVPIAKMSTMQQILYCVVLSPDESDEQQDIMSAEEIEKAAHAYLLKYRVVGANHTKAIDAAPVESYIAPVQFEMTGGQYGPQVVKKGAWVVGLKIFDPKEWAKVVDGDYQGVSVGGFGTREPI